jgi:hypothetical protein
MRAPAAPHQAVARADILPPGKLHLLGRRVVKRREVDTARQGAVPHDERAVGRSCRLAVAERTHDRETFR